MSSLNATSFDAALPARLRIRKMRGLPRAAVWVFLIGTPWVVMVQAVRLVF